MSRILSQSFIWIGSATHSTSDAFRQRQRERIRRMQNNDAATLWKPRKCGACDGSYSLDSTTGHWVHMDAAVAPQMNSEPGNPERDKRAMYRPTHQSASRDSASAIPGPIASPFARKDGK